MSIAADCRSTVTIPPLSIGEGVVRDRWIARGDGVDGRELEERGSDEEEEAVVALVEGNELARFFVRLSDESFFFRPLRDNCRTKLGLPGRGLSKSKLGLR